MTQPSALSREQVEKAFELTQVQREAMGAASMLTDPMTHEQAHLYELSRLVHAQRATIAQQAQEIENLKATQGYNAKFSQVLAQQAQEIERQSQPLAPQWRSAMSQAVMRLMEQELERRQVLLRQAREALKSAYEKLMFYERCDQPIMQQIESVLAALEET